MRFLLTNDDGWRGPGLQVLEEIANEIAEEVWIVSPDLDQSGVVDFSDFLSFAQSFGN
mgnify:CR=1 FL=1